MFAGLSLLQRSRSKFDREAGSAVRLHAAGHVHHVTKTEAHEDIGRAARASAGAAHHHEPSVSIPCRCFALDCRERHRLGARELPELAAELVRFRTSITRALLRDL